MQSQELKEQVQEPRGDGTLTIWLEEEGSDAVARKEMILTLKNSDIQFRKLRRILKDMFDKKVHESFEKKELTQFDLGYRAALNDVYKLIPTTRSE